MTEPAAITVMPCGCRFETPVEGQNINGNYVEVCADHADFPDYAAFRAALHRDRDPDARETIRRFNSRLVEEMRAGYAVRGGDVPVYGTLLLTTTGVRSGLPRTIPIAFQRDGGQFAVQGSAGGRKRQPDWLHNVRADPRVVIEVAGQRLEGMARVLEEEARERVIARSIELRPDTHTRFWSEVAPSLDREVPIVAVETSYGP